MKSARSNSKIILDSEAEDINKEYVKSLFSSIESELLTTFDKYDYNFTFSKDFSNNKMIIKIKMKKNTSVNFNDCDIFFIMIIDKYFPESPPIVKCITNFAFPSLCDGRNLTSSLFPFTWRSNIKVAEIIKNLYHLLNRSYLHSKVRIITSFGQFFLNSLYDLNDFSVDGSNFIFKTQVEIKTLKNNEKIELEKRYLILSDSMMMIFIPEFTSKHLGKLIFYSSLAHVDIIENLDMEKYTDKLLRRNSINKDKTFIRFRIKWKESDIYLGNVTSYDNILVSEINEYINFEQIFQEKRKTLINYSELFSDDYMKYVPSENIKSVDESKLVELAIYHESSFMKVFENGNIERLETQILLKEQAKEIVFLYQKIVEILSIRNDNNFTIYITKMQNFLEIAKSFLEDVKDNNFMLLDASFN